VLPEVINEIAEEFSLHDSVSLEKKRVARAEPDVRTPGATMSIALEAR
jgi:hypothetical protein